MKINKEQFKHIVKECLLEILSEGIGQGVQPQLSQKPRVNETVKRPSASSDLISYGKKQQQPQQDLKKIKEQASALAGGDPIMASIFADTAKTTLPQMLQNESNPRAAMVESNDPTDRLVASATPIDIFGEEAADKWSTLAFAPTSNKIK